MQLFGDAVVTREATTDALGPARPSLEFRGEFLHAFVDTERVKSNKPVELQRGTDRFTADSLDYDNLDRVLELHGRVHGVLVPPPRASRRHAWTSWSSSRALPAASARRWPGATTRPAGGWRWRRGAPTRSSTGRASGAWPPIATPSMAPTWPTRDSIVAAGQACLARQGLPDAVIANAGISIGVDTAVREDIDVMARTFATNTVGLAATFHPFVAAMEQRGSGALVGIAQRGRHPRLARARRLLRQQGGRDQLLRKPARRAARQRRARS